MEMHELLDCATPVELMLCNLATEKLSPINGIMELTPLCNMNCSMCYVRLSREEMLAKGGLCSLDQWLSWASAMKQAGTLFLLLTGGEPLLYPEFKTLYLELQKMGMILTINTNGTLIDEAWADFFAEYPPRRINITLYGTDASTYESLCGYGAGYEKTLRAIKLLKERNLAVKINGSIVSENCSDGERIIEIAEELDAAYKLDTYMYPAEREREKPFHQQSRLFPQTAATNRFVLLKKEHKDDFPNVAKQLLATIETAKPDEEPPSGFLCRAGRSSFMINWQGQMRPCIMVTKPTISVSEHGFAAAWKLLVEVSAKIRTSSTCYHCPLKDVCQVCAASALLETGDYSGTPDYMCQTTKAFVRLLEEEIGGSNL